MEKMQEVIVKVNEIPIDLNQQNVKFSFFLRKKIKEYNDNHCEQVSTKILAKKLQISYEMFRKIVNQSKPTKKRDCIIAIGIVLGLSSADVNEALHLYGMLGFDWDLNREYFIVNQLEQNKPLSIEEFNRRLVLEHYSELDIHDRKRSSENMMERSKHSFRILKKSVRTPITEYYYGDQYDSLGTLYSIEKYKCTFDMLLQDVNDGKKILLRTTTDGYFGAQILGINNVPQCFNSVEESGEYRPFFLESLKLAFCERKKLLAVLNDTKNFKERASARVVNDKMHVFIEEFNYAVPEFNEYYLLDYSKGEYKLSIYSSSAFMKYYLDDNIYKNEYGTFENEPKETYSSIEQIEALETVYIEDLDVQSLLSMRKRAFIRLKEKVDALYYQLLNKQKFIYKIDDVDNVTNLVISTFGLEAEFNCKYDEDYGAIVSLDDKCDFSNSNGERISVSLSDLKTAFELGFENIQDIIRVKSTLGSLEEVY